MAHKSIQMRVIDFLFTDCCTCHNCQIDSFLNNGIHARRAHTHTHMARSGTATRTTSKSCANLRSTWIMRKSTDWHTFSTKQKISHALLCKCSRLKKIHTLCNKWFYFYYNVLFPKGFDANHSHHMRNMQISYVFNHFQNSI